ncbi:MAG TPA: amino acid adenylation domain-containing protein, partial [Pyrinomonadaceae bacterium]|nr:amino acid adenylation domain-containing protein [Pyrinomonadaceae bacterium]
MVKPVRNISELTVEQRALLESRLAQRRERSPKPQPIPRRSGAERSPLSYAQQRLWFLDQLAPGSPFYNGSSSFLLRGQLDLPALERSLGEVVRRHEVLRTTFVELDGSPVQLISPASEVTLPVTDLSGLDPTEREAEADRLAHQEARRPFDLSAGPLLRASLLRLREDEHVLLVTMHHIVSDGWSAAVLTREMTALYAAFTSGADSPLEELPIQYADYAAWQRQHLSGENLERELAYWRQQLGGAPALLELPTDRPRPAAQSFCGAHHPLSLSAELTSALKELSQREGCTLFMTLLAGWQALLSRYSNQEEVVVGTPIANRTRAEVENLIGFFVNTLALRGDLTGEPSFRELLGRVREVTLGAYAHQEVPFERLVEELQPERSLSHQPLFQSMFALQNTPREALRLPGLELSELDVENITTRFDLSLSLTEVDGCLVGTMRYMTDLFETATIERWCEHFRTLLVGIVANPDERVSKLELLSEAEREQVLVSVNRTDRDYPREHCLHELFEAQVELTPGAVAVVCEEEHLSYAELNRRANQLAHHLRAAGVGPDSLVPLCVERSVGMLVGLLGILKAGGGYVPLDPTFPKERLSTMLEVLSPRVIVTQREFAARLPEGVATPLLLDEDWHVITRRGEDNPARLASPESAAYVIFTSGSTGKPKGVVVEHRQILNYHQAIVERLRLEPGARFAMVQPLTVDSSQTMLFPALCTGGTVHVITRERAADPEALMEYFVRHRIDGLKIAPSHLAALQTGRQPERLLPRRWLVIGGEASRREWVEELRRQAPDCSVFNHYGPTEATVGMLTFHLGRDAEVSPSGSTPLGRPLANARAYVLDAHLRPVPKGVPGELYIGGACVARGYLGDAARTAEKFIPDPFDAAGGARLYRTGDLVRHTPEGNLLFIGRDDHQVKIRGFRIELGEIEEILRQHPSVREAVVIAREDGRGDKQLVGYVVTRRDGVEQDAGRLDESLREHLGERVPEYMLPSVIMHLEDLPLSAHGKVNLQALPSPDPNGFVPQDDFVAPRNPLELKLARIWQDILGVDAVGVKANFFRLGGHSLLATQMISRVRRELGVELPLRRLFERPTVEGLADSLERAGAEGKSDAPDIVRAPRDTAPPLSYAQQRLWFLDQLEPGSPFYNSPSAIRLNGRLDLRALVRSLSEVVRRHEVLRTTFVELDGSPVQVISPASELALPVTDLSTLDPTEREAE